MTGSGVDHRLPFTRAMLRFRGLDPNVVRRSEFCQVIRSVWVRRDAVDEDTRIRAALALHPDDAVASHFSAARLLELPVPEHLFEHVTVFRPEDRRWRPELKTHVTTRPRKVVVIRGIRCTDPVTTFIQLAGVLPLVDRVVLGDALVKRYKIAPGRLVRACRESRDHHAGAALAAAPVGPAGSRLTDGVTVADVVGAGRSARAEDRRTRLRRQRRAAT
jgi:hypothetical protein